MGRQAGGVASALIVHGTDDIVGASAHLDIDASDVFADQSKRQKNQSAEEEQDREKGPQRALLLRSVDEPMGEQDDGEDRVEEKDAEAGEAQRAHRQHRKAGDQVEAQ